ncbi:MAG: NAD-dependent epimerase/dehydratase family protein [Lachnospiraceae bacterium]|nr:NAD-dependent epimerase/dehydratase family protein [Lachnospiraceae bacterium]
MNIILLGAAGFIGTNLAIALAKDKTDSITLVDTKKEYFQPIEKLQMNNVEIRESSLEIDTDYDKLLEGQDVLYHLVSTTIPTTSNQHISQELEANVVLTANILEACIRQGVSEVVFMSSGGTVYGKEERSPLKEDSQTYPISSYGVQKITIEKLLYLYEYMYGLDYRVIRLANPYGPYQRPNGRLGAVTTFTYKALKKETINVYGDGTIVRDYIYISDAVNAIIKIANNKTLYRTFNLGSGYGTSINELLSIIQCTLGVELMINYLPERNVDVHINFLDISRYENTFGKLNPVGLDEGIMRTAKFMKTEYCI